MVESLIALLIFTMGFLALISTSARVGLTLNEVHSRYRGAERAQIQVETLMAVPYDSLVGGSNVIDDVAINWKVTETSNIRSRVNTKEVVLAYKFPTPRGERSRVLTFGRIQFN